ncbi:MAG: signal-transduction protein [Acidobacteria bacterium OLB17]|nr:MAG: signal-transduction protein [Acidobacteria bacterium OLB17]
MTNEERAAYARKKCREIMTSNVRTAERRTSLKEAALLMLNGDMGAVPVVEDGKIVGIVTDRDIVVRGVADGVGPETMLGDIMTTDLFYDRAGDYVFEAVRLMGERKVRRLPVVEEDGRLAGIIAMADVALQSEDEQAIAETLEEISSGAGFWQNK